MLITPESCPLTTVSRLASSPTNTNSLRSFSFHLYAFSSLRQRGPSPLLLSAAAGAAAPSTTQTNYPKIELPILSNPPLQLPNLTLHLSACPTVFPFREKQGRVYRLLLLLLVRRRGHGGGLPGRMLFVIVIVGGERGKGEGGRGGC